MVLLFPTRQVYWLKIYFVMFFTDRLKVFEENVLNEKISVMILSIPESALVDKPGWRERLEQWRRTALPLRLRFLISLLLLEPEKPLTTRTVS